MKVCPHCARRFKSQIGFEKHVKHAHRWPNKPKSRRVDFTNEAVDLEVLLLGSLGFSTLYIRDKTGLSESQIIYRLALAGVRRSEYRNGQSPIAEVVLRENRQSLSRKILKTVTPTGR